jgi:hypothetical protein
MVGHRCGCLLFVDASFVELDGSRRGRCSVVEPLTLSWGVQICRSSCLASHWCEAFGKVIEVLHMWQCLLTDLKKILVKQLSTWSLATAKVRVQGGTRSSSWQSHWCHPRAKYLSISFFLCSWRGLKTTFWNLLHMVLLSTRSIWGHRPTGSFEEDETDRVINCKHLWKLER